MSRGAFQQTSLNGRVDHKIFSRMTIEAEYWQKSIGSEILIIKIFAAE
jgi:hypothetical protein